MNITALRVFRLFRLHLDGRFILTFFIFALLTLVAVSSGEFKNREHPELSVFAALFCCSVWGMHRYINGNSCILWRTVPASEFEKWSTGFLWSAIAAPLILIVLINIAHGTIGYFFSQYQETTVPELPRTTTILVFIKQYWYAQAPLFLGTVIFRENPIIKTLFILMVSAIALPFTSLLIEFLFGDFSEYKGGDFENVIEYLIPGTAIGYDHFIIAFVLLCWTLSWFCFRQFEAR